MKWCVWCFLLSVVFSDIFKEYWIGFWSSYSRSNNLIVTDMSTDSPPIYVFPMFACTANVWSLVGDEVSVRWWVWGKVWDQSQSHASLTIIIMVDTTSYRETMCHHHPTWSSISGPELMLTYERGYQHLEAGVSSSYLWSLFPVGTMSCVVCPQPFATTNNLWVSAPISELPRAPSTCQGWDLRMVAGSWQLSFLFLWNPN